MTEPITVTIGLQEVLYVIGGYFVISVGTMFGGWWMFLRTQLKKLEKHDIEIDNLKNALPHYQYIDKAKEEIVEDIKQLVKEIKDLRQEILEIWKAKS